MKHMKRVSILSASLLCVLFFSLTAYAETEGIFTYTVQNGEATVTRVDKGSLEEIVIPETIGGFPVTGLAPHLLNGIYISDWDVLRERAFDDTHPLRRVVLPDGVKNLPAQLFMCQYALEEVRLPADLEEIGDLAFGYCVSLKHIDIPDGVATIRSGAFCDCWSLESLMLPPALRSFGEGNNGSALDYVSSLRYIYAPSGIPGISYNSRVYSWETAPHITVYCEQTEEEWNAVTAYRIPNADYVFAFDAAPYKNVTFDVADGILNISGGPLTFDAAQTARLWDSYAAEIEAITLDETVTEVGEGAFRDLPELRTAVLRAPNVSVGSEAFVNCPQLTNLVATGGVTAANGAFGGAEGPVAVFAQRVEPASGADRTPIRVSYADRTLSYTGSLTQDPYDFLNVISVYCDAYGEIDRLRVSDFTFDGIKMYSYDPETGARSRIDGALTNGVIFPQIEQNGETVPITFNALCDGIADGSLTSFSLAVTDEAHPQTQDTQISIVEQIRDTVQRILRTIVTLLNKFFRLLSSLKR